MLDVVLQTSFMKPIKSGQVKTNFELGHKMEPIIARNFYRECISGEQCLIHVQGIFHAGLFRNGVKEYIAATPDFIALVVKGDEIMPALVEIKTRTTLASILSEDQYHIDSKYTSVSADTHEFIDTIRKKTERIQLLHQAVALGINQSILLIGDNKGRILKGIWVNFPSSIIDAYEKCMDDVYENSLSFLYRAKIQGKTIQETITEDEIIRVQTCLSHQEYIDNIHVFYQEVNKWLALHKKIKHDKQPLLPMSLCVHSLQGIWNRSKGGSDTATGAFRAAWFPLPRQAKTAQGYVCQRILYLMTYQVMKIFSLLMLNENETIDSYRKRINRRNVSFSQFILMMRKTIILPNILPDSGIPSQQMIVHNTCNPDVIITGNDAAVTTGTDDTTDPTSDNHTSSSTSTLVRRTTRNSRRTHIVKNIQTDAQPNRNTPLRYGTTSVIKRLRSCHLPIGLYTLPENNKKIKGSCANCGRRTNYFCLGCRMYWCPILPKEKVKGSVNETIQVHSKEIKLDISNPTRRKLASDGKRDNQKYICSCYALAHLHCIDGDISLPEKV